MQRHTIKETPQTQRVVIVCPVYNEVEAVPIFFDRTRQILNKLPAHYRAELLFLNNASTDGTYDAIQLIRQDHDFVYLITLSRNVGYQRSLECGLRHAKGDILIFIDVDCEDPPEMIPHFLQLHNEGNDIVYGERVDRDENRFIKLCRKVFYHTVRAVADEDILLYMAEFCLITSEVRDAVIQEVNSFPFIRASIARVGFRRIGVKYKRARRVAGRTNYNFSGMLLFAIAGILSCSTLPLRLPIYLLPVWLLGISLLTLAHQKTHDFAFIAIAALLSCLYLGLTAAFIALYVARTYKNGLRRPNYFIHRRLTTLQSA
jgi:glycosyltransferase involved in cell wall biosynthesis